MIVRDFDFESHRKFHPLKDFPGSTGGQFPNGRRGEIGRLLVRRRETTKTDVVSIKSKTDSKDSRKRPTSSSFSSHLHRRDGTTKTRHDDQDPVRGGVETV